MMNRSLLLRRAMTSGSRNSPPRPRPPRDPLRRCRFRRRIPHSAPHPVISHERQRRDGSGRHPQPRPDGSPFEREAVPEHGPMSCQPPPVHRRVRDDDPGTHGQWIPAALTGDPRRQSSVSMDLGKQRRRVRDLGLEFDNEERASDLVPREPIDGSSFALNRECHFGIARPAWELGEHGR